MQINIFKILLLRMAASASIIHGNIYTVEESCINVFFYTKFIYSWCHYLLLQLSFFLQYYDDNK